MVKGIARQGDPNSAGATIVQVGQSSVYVNDKLVSIDGSSVSGHGLNKHQSPTTIGGNQTVFIENIPASRVGDSDTCGHVRISGSSDTFLGDN